MPGAHVTRGKEISNHCTAVRVEEGDTWVAVVSAIATALTGQGNVRVQIERGGPAAAQR